MKHLLFFILISFITIPLHADDELPLDAWVIKKSLKPKETSTPVPEAASFGEVDKNDTLREELIEEEKKVYKALLEGYQDEASTSEKVEVPTAHRIFSRTALSRRDQRRIDNARKMQNRVRKEQMDKVGYLYRKSEYEPLYARFCLASFSILGFPSDVSRFSDVSSAQVTKTWRNFMQGVVAQDCQFVLMTGLVSVTKTKGTEFLDKTVSYIKKSDNKGWEYRMSSSEGMGFYAIVYNSSILQVKEIDEIQSVILRRGGVFEEQHFINSPTEVVFEDVRVEQANKIRIINFDLRNFRKLSSLPAMPHVLQMTSALNELAMKRDMRNPDEFVLLAGAVWAPKSSPAYQILSGKLALTDFLPDGACALNESSEDAAEALFSCDDQRIEPRAQTQFGIVSDLHTPPGQASQLERKIIFLAKNAITSDIFIHANSHHVLHTPRRKTHESSGFREIGTEKYPANFMWVDIQTETLEQ
jgi:hypothetical protein